MRSMNPTERQELAQFLNDLAIDFAERLAAERARHEQANRLLRGTIDRYANEIRELKREGEKRAASDD